MFPNEHGLSQRQVKELQIKYGPNRLPENPPPSNISLIFKQLQTPLVYVLLLAAVLTIIIGHFTDALIICIAVFINTVLGYIQEQKATRALLALKKYITHTTAVIRDGKRTTIHTDKLVPGDIVILEQGMQVPADGVLLFANRLYINESLLTGESLPVVKAINDPVLMGTAISSGQGMFRVTTTGEHTKMGDIAHKVQSPESDTPLQRQLKKFSNQLVKIIILLISIVVVIGIIYKFSITELFVTAIALAVSSIPEGLLVSLTVVLALGMQRIMKQRGLVKKLSAAETLGGVTVICVDKTGTLTKGEMQVAQCIGDKQTVATQAVLANDLDDPMVIAAYAWAKPISPLTQKDHVRLDTIPFSPKERCSMSLTAWDKTSNMLFVNGAPELLLSWSTLPEEEKKDVMETINMLTKQGKRLIGYVQKEVPKKQKTLTVSQAKEQMTWVGMLAFSDPIRAGVKDAIDLAHTAGIKTIVITGDYPNTSRFVLSELGNDVLDEEIMNGDTLVAISDKELEQKVSTIRLFARTTPDQKLRIVDALKHRHEIVAMMGDGVNDAPALHTADIGIVVGDASDVAKESADLILLDSNFSTIIAAIEEGRGMFENIRKIILYLLSDAFAEIVIILGGILLRLPLPITAVQILWVNLVSDGFTNLALTIDPKRKHIMKEHPRRVNEHLVTPWMMTLIAIVSGIAGITGLLSFVIVYNTTNDLLIARSFAFLTLGLDSLMYVFSIRSLMTPFWKNNIFENKWLVLAVLSGGVMQWIPFSTPTLRTFFGLAHLSIYYWLAALGISLFMFFVIEILKAIHHLLEKRRA